MFKKILSRIIFLLYINYLYCLIVLPLDTLPRENYCLFYDINSPRDIMDQENKKSFFTTFEIGSPIQKVPLIIKPKTNFYLITSVHPVINTTIDKNYKKFNFSKHFFETYDFYNENKSETAIINWCRENEYYNAEECCSVNDGILMYKNINLEDKNIININFELMRNVEDNITGEIGLNIYDEVGRFYNTFLGILKTNNLINNYNWYFDFDNWNDEKGKLVIGSLPHEDYPNLYSEDDLLFTGSNTLSRLSYMEMKFDKVYIIEKDVYISYYNENAELRYDSNIIIGDYSYGKYLLGKIDYLLKSEKCFNDTIRDLEYYNNLSFYYCLNEKDIKNKLYEVIIPIHFYSNNFNKTFEITNTDVLFEKGDYIYIGILFNDITRKWSLGKVFTLKYKFIFNQENKKIGFYNGHKKEKNNKNKNYGTLLKILICIILSIILVFLGIKFGKILNKSRKKRANELLDEYDYSERDNENKGNINNEYKNINEN